MAFDSPETYTQSVDLQPISPSPTYVVDLSGKVVDGYSYVPTSQKVHLVRSPGTNLDLKLSFEPYMLSLVTDDVVQIHHVYTVDMGGGGPYDPYLLFFAFTQHETKIGQHHLLVYPFAPTVWLMDALDGAGNRILSIPVPNDPTLPGIEIYHQFITYHTAIEEISNLSTTHIVQ